MRHVLGGVNLSPRRESFRSPGDSSRMYRIFPHTGNIGYTDTMQRYTYENNRFDIFDVANLAF